MSERLKDSIRGALCRPDCKAHEAQIQRVADAVSPLLEVEYRTESQKPRVLRQGPRKRRRTAEEEIAEDYRSTYGRRG